MLDDISALHISTARSTYNMDTTLDADSVITINIASDEQQLNSSSILQCSMSSLESESDLSLAFEHEMGKPVGCDELPAFEIRAYSPHGRTPSPIDDLNVSDVETPKQEPLQQRSPGRHNNPEFVALHEINAQISAPNHSQNDSTVEIKHANSLETIFEGVFLHTPPRDKLNKSAGCGSNSNSAQRFTPKRSRANLMELVAMNRLHLDGQENQLPSNQLQDELT